MSSKGLGVYTSQVLSETGVEAGRRLPPPSRRFPKALWAPLAYLVAIAAAEAVTTLSIPQLGMTLHGLLLVTIVLHAALFARGPQLRFLITLMLAPLIRLMSLSLPLPRFPFVYWYVVIGVPLFLAVFLTMRVVGFTGSKIGLTMRAWFSQIIFGLTGLGLGYIEYLILRPEPLVESFTWEQIWLPALILLLFTGLLEEIIFRGVIQRSAMESLGRYAPLYVAALFAILHLGYRSALDVFFVFGVALLFGAVVARTGSILGATLSHGLTNVSLYLIIPFILSPPTSPAETAALFLPPANPHPLPPMTALASADLGESPAPEVAADSPSAPSPTVTPLHPVVSVSPELITPTPTPTPLVLDDGDPQVRHVDGLWWLIDGGIDGDLHWFYAMPDEATTIVEWRPEPLVCGTYRLEVFLPPRFATTRSARYQISHSGGVEEVTLDQSAHQGEWAELGIFQFDPGKDVFLRLTNATGEEISSEHLVAFDAARWSLIAPCEGGAPPP